VQHGSADTVVRATNAYNGKCRFSGYASSESETPWPIFKKNGTVDYVGDPTPHASFGVSRFKGAYLRMHEIVTLRRLFVLFFNGSCASLGLEVGPLDRSSSLTAQMTRPRGVHVHFIVSLIKKLFSLFFYLKMWKIALHPMETLNSYNFGTVYMCFMPWKVILIPKMDQNTFVVDGLYNPLPYVK